MVNQALVLNSHFYYISLKISVIIDEKYLELAVRALHTAFDLDRESGESSARA